MKLAASAFGSFVLATVAAHAAPTPAPTVRPGPAPTALVALKRVEATVVPVASKCGEPTKARVTLRNRTLQPWAGTVNLVTDGTVNTPVTLAASGDDAEKTVDVAGGTLDCTKKLQPFGLRVWKDPSAPILTQVLRPKRVAALAQPTAVPPPTETRPWVRRVTYEGRCGEAIAPTMVVQNFGSAPQEAKVKLAFGAATKEGTFPLTPGQATFIAVEVATLDCASGPVPTFQWALANGISAQGSLAPTEVTFE